jgi:hypothetical protein
MTATVHVSTTMGFAAGAAAIGFAGIAVFQFGLALGAPFGRAAWSGTIPGRLPARLRVGCLVAGLMWSFAVLVVWAGPVSVPYRRSRGSCGSSLDCCCSQR